MEGTKQISSTEQHLQPDAPLERIQRTAEQAGDAGAMLIAPWNIGTDQKKRDRIFRSGLPQDTIELLLAPIPCL